VFGVAAAIRVALATDLWRLPIVRTPKLDSFEYVSWAQRIAAGDFAWPLVAQHGPGYPFFLAGLLALFGSLHAALVVQAIVCAATAALVAAVGRTLVGDRAGLLAGLTYAVYGPAAWIETSFVAEGLLLFLLTAALFALSRAPLTTARAAAAGAALGAAVVVRPTALLIGGALAVWIIVSLRQRQSGAGTLAAALAAACLIVVAPALARGWTASHTLSMQGYGGLNFYIGNSPAHTGRATIRLGAGWDALNSEAARAGIEDPTAQDRYYVSKTLAEIRDRPAAFVRLLAAKILWSLQAEEVRDSHSYYFFTDRSLLLRVLPRMSILLPLAAVGVVALVRRRSRAAILLYFFAGAIATPVLFVVGSRYRMPLVPVLAVAAGAGLDGIATAVGARDVKRLIVCGAAAAAALVLSHLRDDPRNHNLAEEWSFTGSSLVTEHDLGGADAAYRQAIAIDSTSGLAWDGLGLVALDQGRLPAARDAFLRARSLDPDSARAAYHLGLVEEREGHLDAAIRDYLQARALAPFDLDVVRHAGGALLAAQRPGDALPLLRTAADQLPNDARAQYAYGTALAMTGASAEARAAIRRVVELEPSNGEAWLDYCLLSFDARDVEVAAAALERARALGAAPERVAAAAAAIQRVRK
jgi:Flp pilus assembly protein TadD/4-amino-4-deoxy-L-arabinose transferase-like glycosyltransferase